MKRISHNTGRQYTQHGQRLTAVEHNGLVYFKDHDRLIEGAFDPQGKPLTIQVLMKHYDQNLYMMAVFPKDVQETLDLDYKPMKQLLTKYANQIDDLRQDQLFDAENKSFPDGLATTKFLQALALLDQAHHVMKEASYHAN